MKILIVSQYFYPENFRINDFAFSLSRRGHEVTVLTGLPNYPKGKLFGEYKLFRKQKIQGINVLRVPLVPRFSSKGWQLFVNYLSFLFSSIFFGPFILRRESFDVVLATSYSPASVGVTGVIFSKLKKAKMTLWVQDLWPDSLKATGAINSKFILGLIGFMVKWIYSNSDFILMQSEAFRQPILDLKIPKKQLLYFPNWAEDLYISNKAEYESTVRKLIPNKKFIVMFAGNLGKAQSLETILKAAALTQDSPVHWIILGDGREKQMLEESISKLKMNNISLLGSFPVETMPSFFCFADVLLVTLKTDPIFSATIPGKLQSYMLSSKPVIAALDGEGARVIKKSRCGLTVASGDHKGLAKSVLEMSEKSKKEMEDMGKRGLDYYSQNFDREMLISKFESWVG